jgi:D-tyrosyl-tRNA(Tyr) deacylase
MRAVVQRVKKSAVTVDQEPVAAIGPGLLVLLGVHRGDTKQDAEYLANKIVHLRIFEDPDGKFNLSLPQVGGQVMVVSQFTLYGDCRKGRRPSFVEAAPPETARGLYVHFVDTLRRMGLAVETGEFQALMDVSLVNSGPVTLILESKAFRHGP